MELEGQAGCGPDEGAKPLPNDIGELGFPVRDHVHRKAMTPEHMWEDQLSSLFGWRKLWQRDEMHYLAEPVSHRQDGGVPLGWRSTSYKVQGYVEPGAMRNLKWVQESSWGLVGRFVLVTDGAGFNKSMDILVPGLPPEPMLEKFFDPLDPWVAGEMRAGAPRTEVGTGQRADQPDR